MGTNSRAVEQPTQRGPYKHHESAFKRALAEASRKPGASVARIARDHGIKANQLFHWRKLHREGKLGESSPALLPVTVEQRAIAERSDMGIATGTLTIDLGRIRLRIEGRPDAQSLRLVLGELRRP